MALLNQNKVVHKRVCKSSKDVTDFSSIGGLEHHLKTLRDMIIFPLLHANVFTHFNIKAPRGVLFYGPPGTGKTLVAGALATEINREGVGKVTFFQRKGADILDKWVGESEKKLRELFEKAGKSKPSIIFFDEIDGLAPARSQKNDHIHSSIVATLLSLMDGLDNQPGVIVIGATNRVEFLDPALRRPGRFDKELYFPLPSTEARKEIIQVHTRSWKYKPTGYFLNHLADITGGFCGSDLQALCAETILCCMKKNFPIIQTTGKKIKIEAEALKVDNSDFLDARLNILPSALKHGCKMRSLSSIIKPLLDRQLTNIMRYIETLWPHFLQEGHKYTTGGKRYAGRVVLVGSNNQGLNTHLIPAILQKLEHLPMFVYDIQRFLDKNIIGAIQFNFPSILLLSRVDEWWRYIDDCEQVSIVASLEEIHAGLPILTIATCKVELPPKLHDFFYNNSSILINIEAPTSYDREVFLAPLFFDEKIYSLFSALEQTKKRIAGRKFVKSENVDEPNLPQRRTKTKLKNVKRKRNFIKSENVNASEDEGIKLGKRKNRESNSSLLSKRIKFCEDKFGVDMKASKSLVFLHKKIKKEKIGHKEKSSHKLDSTKSQHFIKVLSDLLNYTSEISSNSEHVFSVKTFMCDKLIKLEPITKQSTSVSKYEQNSDDQCIKKIYDIWKHASLVTSKNMHLAQLELLYDVISACINIYRESFGTLVENLEDTLRKIEISYKQ